MRAEGGSSASPRRVRGGVRLRLRVSVNLTELERLTVDDVPDGVDVRHVGLLGPHGDLAVGCVARHARLVERPSLG